MGYVSTGYYFYPWTIHNFLPIRPPYTLVASAVYESLAEREKAESESETGDLQSRHRIEYMF